MCVNLSLFSMILEAVILSFTVMFHEKRVLLPLNPDPLLSLWIEILYILCEHSTLGYVNSDNNTLLSRIASQQHYIMKYLV